MIIGGSPFNAAPLASSNRILIPLASTDVTGNLRIVTNNIADSATLAASSTSGSLVIDNVKTEHKGEIHRSVGTSVTYTVTWASDQTIGCVCLPCTNLSITSVIRIRLFDSTSTAKEDTGDLYAVSGTSTNTSVFDVNNFAYGGISKSIVWFSLKPTYVRSMTIELTDTSNLAGYIDNSRIIAGDYWEPTYNLEKGMQFYSLDGSTTSESNAGSLVTVRGFIRDKVSIDFALLPESDRVSLLDIIRSVGTYKNMLLSIFPETYNSYESDFLIYGKRSNAPITNTVYGYYKHALEVTSW